MSKAMIKDKKEKIRADPLDWGGLQFCVSALQWVSIGRAKLQLDR